MGKYTRKTRRTGKPIIGEEAALKTFQEILNFYDIGIPEGKDEKAEKDAEAAFDDLVTAIRWGELEVENDGDFKIIQHLANGESFTYKEINVNDLTFRASLNMETDAERSTYKFLGRLSGEGEDVIYLLKGQDKETAGKLAMVFFLR
jgi:hypothetical protein